MPSLAHALIPHRNRPQQCLQAAGHFLALPEVTLTILDNRSEPAALEQLKAGLPEKVELLELPKNLGWGPALNVGLANWLARAASEFCFVAAHDAQPQGACVSQLLSCMSGHPRLGVLCPQYPVPEMGVFSPVRGPRSVSVRSGPPGTVASVGFAHGTLSLYRRPCLRQIGLFDERYFAYGDEMDLSLRARRAGWRVGQLWGAVVRNPETTCLSRPLIAYLCCRNSLLLAHAHGSWIAAAARVGLVLLNSARLASRPAARRRAMEHPRERVRALADFLLGRFGAPRSLADGNTGL